jgi:hypothetical protein
LGTRQSFNVLQGFDFHQQSLSSSRLCLQFFGLRAVSDIIAACIILVPSGVVHHVSKISAVNRPSSTHKKGCTFPAGLFYFVQNSANRQPALLATETIFFISAVH